MPALPIYGLGSTATGIADKSALRQYIVRLRGTFPMVLGKLQYRLWFSPTL